MLAIPVTTLCRSLVAWCLTFPPFRSPFCCLPPADPFNSRYASWIMKNGVDGAKLMQFKSRNLRPPQPSCKGGKQLQKLKLVHSKLFSRCTDFCHSPCFLQSVLVFSRCHLCLLCPFISPLPSSDSLAGDSGIFSRALSAGGAPLFLATISQEGTTPDNMPGKSTLETSAGPDAAEKETTEKHDDGASTHAVGRPEKEQGAYAEKGKEPPSEPPAALGKAPAAAPMFGRTISAPAAPAWLLRRSASVAVNPSALETSPDTSANSVLEKSLSSSLETSPNRDDETLKPADTASQERIAPSRARAGATATFSRAMSAPMLPSPGASGAPAKPSETVDKFRVPTPPTDERESGFGRAGSAARAAAAGVARFRKAASKVTSVLRVVSAGKARTAGTVGEGQIGEENAKDDLHMKSAEKSDGIAMFGFKRTMSAPSAPVGDGV